MIQKQGSPPEVYSSYFSAAIRCQSHISVMAEKGSLPERYVLVLEELRVEAVRQARRMNPSTTAVAGLDSFLQENGFEDIASMPLDNTPSTVASHPDLLGEAALDFNGMPSSAFSAAEGWGQFVSMVSSGLGNFDCFLSEDSL